MDIDDDGKELIGIKLGKKFYLRKSTLELNCVLTNSQAFILVQDSLSIHNDKLRLIRIEVRHFEGGKLDCNVFAGEDTLTLSNLGLSIL